MTGSRCLVVLGLTLLILSGGTAVARADSYVVVYKGSGPDRVPANRVDAETNARERVIGFESRYRYKSALRGFAARLSTTGVERLKRDPEVAIVERDVQARALGMVPIAPGEKVPPGIARIGAARAGSGYEASSTNVAVVDTGVDLTHPDLATQSGKNCIGPGVAQDDNGHGTEVAGVIAARNSGTGVIGVAPGSKIFAVKVLAADGFGLVSQVICGIEWVTANAAALNIRVVNLSLGLPGLGGPCADEALHLAICHSVSAGLLYVVAAGNDGGDFGAFPPVEPAVFPEVLTVTAMSDSDGVAGGTGGPASCTISGTQVTDPDDFRASFSDFATADADVAHTIAAPGVCIESTALGHGYAFEAGTSFAVPHVSGVAALCLGQGTTPGPCAGLTPAEMIRKLRSDAAQFGGSGNGFTGDPGNPLFGYFGDLVSAEQSTRPVASPPTPSVTTASPSPPRPATRVKRKRRSCLVPTLRGKTRGEARKKLKRAGCRYRARGRGSRVTSTVPKAGKRTSAKVLVRLSARNRR